MIRPLAAGLALSFVLLPAQDRQAELLQSLSLEQKAGQLFVSWSLSRSENGNHEKLLAFVRDAELGGVILSLGTVDDAAALIPQLQQAAKVPLLLASDFEGGVWFRLTGAAELGNQMLWGATRSEWLCEQAGRVTGEEAKALGFHWVFAPVLDVNSNPANPIINVRSFGEDPEMVARLGSAFARGVRGAGLLACGKHFPGHGDVDSDSHLALPTVPGDGERLRRVELRPFAAAAKDGLESVMTGHLGVPGLGEDPALPATLSPRILGDVLRGELGFQGLVVTDALEMGGVKNAFPAGEVAVRALLAGADVLLMPPDPIAARTAVVDAVKSGRVPLTRLDDAVRRILAAKAKVGLLAGGGAVAADWRSRVGTAAGKRLAAKIAARGLTLVRDRGEVLRQPRGRAAETLLLVVRDQDDGGESHLAAECAAAGIATVAIGGASDAAAVAAATERVQQRAARVIVALHAKVHASRGGIGLPPAVQPVLAALRDDQEVVGISFGSPYLVRDLPVLDAYVCAYVATYATEEAVADVLLRGATIDGRLPVAIPGVAAAGHGLIRYRPDLAVSDLPPPGADVDAALPKALKRILDQAVADHAFPGAVCVVGRMGSCVARVHAGHLGYADGDADAYPDTRYDLASLTKVCATLPAVLRLVAAGKLSLDDPVQKWVPAFAGTGKERVTVRHLLAHCGGLPAYERYYRTLQGKDAIVEAAAREGLMTEPGTGTTYSDLGFILLMAVVEKAAGQPFQAVVNREVFAPLRLRGACFAPTGDGPLGDAAPTEDDPQRGGVVRGYVHDENAFAMGGISGHAGMFATADDVLKIGFLWLGGGRGLLPAELVDAATHPAGLVPGDATRAVGLQMLAPGWAGTTVSPNTFGHTGFTGTSLWCDPELDACVVLLTNRVHPTRVNNRIQEVRRAVHDAVRAAMR